MFLLNVNFIVTTLVFCIFYVNGSFQSEALLELLLRQYNRVIKPDGQVNVHHSITLTNIVNYENYVLTANVWIQQAWRDTRLQWNPTEFGNITRLNIPHTLLWKPDIVLYNNAGADDGLIYKDLNVILNSNGQVSYITPMRLVSQCTEQGSGFLDRKAVCKWTFGSWTFSGLDMDIDNGTYFNMDEYSTNPRFEVLTKEAMKNVHHYECCPEPYTDVTYTLEFRRTFDDD